LGWSERTQAIETESAEERGGAEIEATGFGRALGGQAEIEQGEAGGVVAQDEETAGGAGDGGEAVEL